MSKDAIGKNLRLWVSAGFTVYQNLPTHGPTIEEVSGNSGKRLF